MRRLFARVGLGSKPLLGWALYDWANSAFYTIVVTAVYPVFFNRFAAAGAEEGVASIRHANATTLALVVVAVLSPLLGVAADSLGAKKMLLGIFLALGVVATAATALVHQGQWQLASACFVLGNIGIVGSLVFYDSLLPHLVGAGRREEEMDRVSSAGYALGYLGGGLALLFALVAVGKPQLFGFADQFAAMRASFVVTAVWWGLFSIPLFRWVPEPPAVGPRVQVLALPGVAIRELANTFRHLRLYRQAFLLLVAVAIYMDGVGTIVRMAAAYASDLKLSTNVIIATILVIQFVGIPFAFIFGALGARIGAKRAILVGLAIYVGISVYAYFVRGATGFVVLGLLVATVQGGVQALSRSLFASFVPPQRSSEFFGFFSVFEKFAGILGPAVFAAVVAATGSSRAAIFGIVVFFVVGGALLTRVDVEEGRRAAQAAATDEPPPEPAPAEV
jgi:UMF1 family MFS transporter